MDQGLETWVFAKELAHTTLHRMSFLQRLWYGRRLRKRYEEACEEIAKIQSGEEECQQNLKT